MEQFMSDKTLLKFFKASSKYNKNQEKEVLEQVLSLMKKTANGRQAIHDISELDYTIAFEDTERNIGGFCSPTDSTIVLSRFNIDHPDLMASTLVHEATHAKQNDKFNPDLYGHTISDVIKYIRATEADAIVHQVLHEQEMIDQGIDIMTRYDFEHKTYEQALKKTGNKKSAAQAVFRSFYSNSQRMNFYDTEILKTCCVNNEAEKKPLSNKDILSCCKLDEKPYVDADFLDSPQAFSLRAKDKSRIIKSTLRNSEKYKVKPDLSVLKMFTRTDSGHLKTSEPIDRSPTRILATFKQTQR